MKGTFLTAAALLAVIATAVCFPQGLADPTLSTPEGDAVPWSVWTQEHGPAVIVLWGSWMPGSDGALASVPDIQTVAARRGLELVVVALQESRQESGNVLGDMRIPWLHDRHGVLLKVFRVYDIPAMVVVAADGAVLARLEVSSQALQDWERHR